MAINYGISFDLQDDNAKAWIKKSSSRLTPGGSDFVNGILKFAAQSAVQNGNSIPDIAKDIQSRLGQTRNVSKVSAIRTARTMMTAASNGGKLDSFKSAAKLGIDIQKQWVSTLDIRTRNSHRWLDGETVDVNKKFPNGLQYPGDSKGSAAEVYNCRCTMKAYMPDLDNTSSERWSKTQDGTREYTASKTYQEWAKEKGIVMQERPKTFTAVKKTAEKVTKKTTEKAAKKVETSRHWNKTSTLAESNGIKYNQVEKRTEALTEEQIIELLSGGDLTGGSCASLAYAWAGQRGGYNVIDYRGGDSRSFFAKYSRDEEISKFAGVKCGKFTDLSSLSAGKSALKAIEKGKEYILATGGHASVVRKTEKGVLQYLELQAGEEHAKVGYTNGWHNFMTGNSKSTNTLMWRFGCTKTQSSRTAYLFDVESLSKSDEFADVLGYINTAADKQMKGAGGTVR